jgi:hypothetical protein
VYEKIWETDRFEWPLITKTKLLKVCFTRALVERNKQLWQKMLYQLFNLIE